MGAIRLLEMGNLPFTKELKDFHRAKLEERGKAGERPVNFQMVIDDVYAIGKGFLVDGQDNAQKAAVLLLSVEPESKSARKTNAEKSK